ncbi:MAG: hypothetical protein ACRBN8_00645 [Nannocystales bacterium]
MTARLLLVALCVSAGCSEDPAGPLDPETVSALASEVGDAQGVAPSGVYAVQLTAEDCGCMDVNTALLGLTLCQGAPFGRNGNPSTFQTTFDVVVSDGIVDIASEFAASNPVGALDADGAFDIGAVIRLTSFATTGFQVTRAEGSIDAVGDSDYDIEGTIMLRLIGRVELEGLDEFITEVDDVDCTESMRFTGNRYIVR